jgi:hypothetical protein
MSTNIAGFSAVPPTITDKEAQVPAPMKLTIPRPVPKRFVLISASLKVVGQVDDLASASQMADAVALESDETVYVVKFSEASIHVPRKFVAPRPPQAEKSAEQVQSEAEVAARKAAKDFTKSAAASLKDGFESNIDPNLLGAIPTKPSKPEKANPTRAEREAELNALSADEAKKLAERAGLPHNTKAEAVASLLDAEF